MIDDPRDSTDLRSHGSTSTLTRPSRTINYDMSGGYMFIHHVHIE